ncbi:hypothetical protein [Bradyrhizobium embrapense]|uniref:hypothetical protein n=1 Tax=Bradyrhizobium embrapense TaxID=630921 RepID=UPI00067D147E|nr:hypothetical protein [Bradyrhizobium embrapense]
MSETSNCFQNERQDPITPMEAYDPAYWRRCATWARTKAGQAPAHRAAALAREAADYERLAAYANAVRAAGEATV